VQNHRQAHNEQRNAQKRSRVSPLEELPDYRCVQQIEWRSLNEVVYAVFEIVAWNWRIG
jgi:hypothetical protein